MNNTGSQTKAIKAHLESGRPLTQLQALQLYGSLRLGARIFDLRERGMPIETRIVEANGSRIAEYRIKK